MIEVNILNQKIREIAAEFLEKSKNSETLVISHFDTDGISSAAIMTQSLRKLDRKFSLKIVKSLEKDFIESLPKDKIILFLDLGSGSIHNIYPAGLKDVFIIDHHEIDLSLINSEMKIINPELSSKQKISASGLVYLFCKELDESNSEFSKLAILGMIGDTLEKQIDKLNNQIILDGDIKKKRGVLIYPSTRPLNRTLEYCSNPFIPEVTGNPKGVTEILRETGLNCSNGKYKSLMELNEEEMEKLVTAIMLRNPKIKQQDIIGDIFLIKFYNKLEDARELSAQINACSRMGYPDTALQFCLEMPKAKHAAETLYTKYRQNLISGLKFIKETEKINGKGFVIINAKDKIKDTMVGTFASILSKSALYEEGTIITTMAYNEDKIKVSVRNVGREGRNVREVLSRAMVNVGGEVGGHEFAAGCLIKKDQEKNFIENLKRNLEIELVKI